MTAALRQSESQDDDRYAEFLEGIQDHFDETIRSSPHLFTTGGSEALWDIYIRNSPVETRAHRTCNACKNFITRFGGLVSIGENGKKTSAIWPKTAPPLYAKAAKALKKFVENASVQGVFRSSDMTWGNPVTGAWTHPAVVVPTAIRWTGKITTAEQEMAVKLEEFKMLERTLVEFSKETVLTAVGLLSSESLYRSEKCEGVAKWLLAVHGAPYNKKWLAVASAPAGYCHVRSSMIGTLLEDIQAGLPFDSVKRKFAEKMNPLQYMRPTAAPSAGNLAQAEKIVAQLRSAGSLERRFAKLSDIQALWTPKPVVKRETSRGPVFGHLGIVTHAPRDLGVPPKLMTWAKFRETVLPNAEEIEFLVPHGNQAFTAMVTAVDPTAPNLLQWDNPVSHYVYASGSEARQWNLTAGTYARVNAVSLRSWMWNQYKDLNHHGAGVVFILAGCRDLGHVKSGGMFPESMKSEYHGIRATLEAYFAQATIAGKDEASACGIALTKGAPTWNLTFRVTSRGIRTSYKLDRWD